MLVPKNDLKMRVMFEDSYVFHDYDEYENNPIPIHAVRDVEVERAFRAFLDSVSYMVGESGVSFKEGTDKYSEYIYLALLLNEVQTGEIPIPHDRERAKRTPYEFMMLYNEALTNSSSENGPDTLIPFLEKAEQEMLNTISSYMAQKYGRDIVLSFDGNYAVNAFGNTGNLFDDRAHQEHLNAIYDGTPPEPIISIGTPTALYGGFIERTYSNGETVDVPVTVDTRNGAIVVSEDKPIPDGELVMIQKEELRCAGVKVDVTKVDKNDDAIQAIHATSIDYLCDVKPIVDAVSEKGPSVHQDYIIELDRVQNPKIPKVQNPKQSAGGGMAPK